jgi:predicted DNA binding CopG/RHH family protein
MFSTIKKILSRVRSFDALYNRIDKIEVTLHRLEKLADENASLWQFLDDQKEMDKLFVGTSEEFEEEFTDIMIRNMKPRGDA